MCDPEALETKTGSAPTDLKALTGLLTPPGIISLAAANSSEERRWFMANLVI
jgi:hypothetical protein